MCFSAFNGFKLKRSMFFSLTSVLFLPPVGFLRICQFRQIYCCSTTSGHYFWQNFAVKQQQKKSFVNSFICWFVCLLFYLERYNFCLKFIVLKDFATDSKGVKMLRGKFLKAFICWTFSNSFPRHLFGFNAQARRNF